VSASSLPLTLIERGVAGDKLDLAEELVSLRAPASLEADQYRTLRQSIERMHRDSALQVVAITSATPGDGKTITTLNLAGALATSRNNRVIVIDADLHQPAIADYLGLPASFTSGLATMLQNEKQSLSQSVVRLESLNLSVLPAGDADQPFGMLASPRFDSIVAEARRSYDYVLIDTAPVVPLADCRLIERAVDGFILIIAAHKTPRKFLGEAVETLNLLEHSKVLGIVFNGDDRPLTPYYGYYYGAGQKRARARARART